MNGEV